MLADSGNSHVDFLVRPADLDRLHAALCFRARPVNGPGSIHECCGVGRFFIDYAALLGPNVLDHVVLAGCKSRRDQRCDHCGRCNCILHLILLLTQTTFSACFQLENETLVPGWNLLARTSAGLSVTENWPLVSHFPRAE